MTRIFSFACFLLLASLPLHGQTSEARVLVIGIDGLRPDCLLAANTPALNSLIAEGIFSPDALNNDITYSGPGWSGMICGVWSDKHGVTGNNFVGSNFEAYPSFMRRLELENSALNTYSICHWAPINDYILWEDVDEAINVSTDAAVRDGAVSILENADPHAMFLHFDDVDINGHGFGFNANVSEYMNAIEATDQFISDILVALTSRPNYADENWLTLVSTDHGGIGFNHGGTSIEEETIFFIASGDAVSPNVLIKDTLEILPAPENCIALDAAELQFGGDGDAVVIEDHPSLQLGTDQDFTLEVRIRAEATPDVAIFGNKDWDSGLNPGFVFSFEYPNGPAWKVNIGDGNQRADANGSNGVADGQWHTLSCSFDRDGMMRLYTDGEFSAEEDISFINDIDVSNGWFAGSDIFGAYSYTGAIAEIRFWQGVIPEEVIANWHCSALDATHPQWESLQGHWALTEGAGMQANNNVSEELTGTIQGATWNEPEGVIAFDYSNTPRIVDVAATALDHMCLNTDSNWGLDGISWVDGCNSADIERMGRNTIKTNLFPNPGTDAFQITGLSSGASIEVFDPRGQSIHFAGPGTGAHSMPHASGQGVYLIRIVDGEERRTLRWVRQ